MTAAIHATVNVCSECDGSGRAAIESDGRGNHQLGDCPKCVKPCCICRMPFFIAALRDGCCDECWKLDFPMNEAGAQR